MNDQTVVQEERLAPTSFLGVPEPLVGYGFDSVIQPCIPPIHLKIKSLILLTAASSDDLVRVRWHGHGLRQLTRMTTQFA